MYITFKKFHRIWELYQISPGYNGPRPMWNRVKAKIVFICVVVLRFTEASSKLRKSYLMKGLSVTRNILA